MRPRKRMEEPEIGKRNEPKIPQSQPTCETRLVSVSWSLLHGDGGFFAFRYTGVECALSRRCGIKKGWRKNNNNLKLEFCARDGEFRALKTRKATRAFFRLFTIFFWVPLLPSFTGEGRIFVHSLRYPDQVMIWRLSAKYASKTGFNVRVRASRLFCFLRSKRQLVGSFKTEVYDFKSCKDFQMFWNQAKSCHDCDYDFDFSFSFLSEPFFEIRNSASCGYFLISLTANRMISRVEWYVI